MTVDDVIKAAQAQTGLTGFGDPAILEGLEVLLKSYASEAHFSERGAQMAHGDLVKWMAIRMQIEDWLARHPDLLDAPVEKPMFVFGLPRTGTTLVINLLASDPARRSFLRWESQEPVPPARPDELHAGPRWEKMDAQTKMALQYMPQIAAIHFEEADSPTECQFLMTPSFCSQVYESQADVPGYREWFLHKADYLPAFRFHKRYLQMLQANTGGRWTLKNPWHPLYLPALKEVYPDAQLVMTHRDPADVLGSIGSLIENVRKIYSDDVDLQRIGEQFIETFQIMIERQDAFRAQHGPDSILDIQYADVVKDPIGQVRAIYEHFGEPFTAEAEAAMHAYMDANPKGKHGKHEYSLERYGLSREGVHKTFAEYIERYQIPVKR
ncbi:sulfotransferase family protein [Novosphingobium beihaiensis]|uniref:Sulfotransferase n=1 Tax=Novosphingobium beihaiensis TaxID=2930389 RepID=A0ABT0BP97_9SPHN|nr:sulfotransferase [Novosphingobium beihaiensis]MCJ2186872.1 sulfotransferase [Novosphingobium beihaiensis]